jgi:hypothetical protein
LLLAHASWKPFAFFHAATHAILCKRHETTLSIAAEKGLCGKILQIGYNLENFVYCKIRFLKLMASFTAGTRGA